MFTLHQLLAVILTIVTSAGSFSHESRLVRAVVNDNRHAAGIFKKGVLTVALEVREAAWYPDGDKLAGASIEAFGEVGKNPSVPGPLLRMPAGTEIRASLRNSLPRDTITFYIPAKLSRNAPSDQLEVVMERRHLEHTFAGELEGGDLDDHRHPLEHEDAANDRQQQLLLDENGHGAERAAQ